MSNATQILIPLSHQPVTPVRNHLGELVYAKLWQSRITDKLLSEILYHTLRVPTERDSNIAASVFIWLGTNCGRSFIDTCNRRHRERPTEGSREEIYIGQWGYSNYRKRHQNEGNTLLESILKPGPKPDVVICGTRCLDLSVDDYETASHLIGYIASDDGQLMVLTANRILKELHFSFPPSPGKSVSIENMVDTAVRSIVDSL